VSLTCVGGQYPHTNIFRNTVLFKINMSAARACLKFTGDTTWEAYKAEINADTISIKLPENYNIKHFSVNRFSGNVTAHCDFCIDDGKSWVKQSADFEYSCTDGATKRF
jgi:hypothetical protein